MPRSRPLTRAQRHYNVQPSMLYPGLEALVCPNCQAHRDLPHADIADVSEVELPCPLCGEPAIVPRIER